MKIKDNTCFNERPERCLACGQILEGKVDTPSPIGQEPKPKPDYEAMYFEGDATIKRVYVTIKEHMERRFVKIEAKHTPQGKKLEGE